MSSSSRPIRHVVRTSNQPRDIRDLDSRRGPLLSDSTNIPISTHWNGEKGAQIVHRVIPNSLLEYGVRKSERSITQSESPSSVPAPIYESYQNEPKVSGHAMRKRDVGIVELLSSFSGSTASAASAMSLEEEVSDIFSSSVSSEGPFTDISSESSKAPPVVRVEQGQRAIYSGDPSRICRDNIMGHCINECNCPFDHVLFPRLSSQQKEQHFRRRRRAVKREICLPFLAGNCRWGDLCDRIHPELAAPTDNLTKSVTAAPLSVPMPTPAVKLAVAPAPRTLHHSRQRRRGPSPVAATAFQQQNLVPHMLALSTRSSHDLSVQNIDVSTRPSFTPAFSMRPIIVNYRGKVSGHINLPQQLSSQQLSSIPITAIRPTEACREWTRGNCSRGALCRYLHLNNSGQLKPDILPNAAVATSYLKVNARSSNVSEQLQTSSSPAKVSSCILCLLGLCYNHNRREGNTRLKQNSICPLDYSNFRVSEKKDTQPIPEAVPPAQSSHRRDSSAEVITETVLANTRVTVGPGFQVMDVMTGFEASCVAIGNLPSSVTEDDVRKIVEAYGDVVKVIMEGKSADAQTTTVRVYYAKAKEAALAIQELHGGIEFFNTITAKLVHFEAASRTGKLDDTNVRIDIPAPGFIAYAGYGTEEEAKKIISSVSGKKIGDCIVSVKFHQGLPRLGVFNLKFEGLPSDTTENDIKKFGTSEGVMFTRARYASLSWAISGVRRLLEECGEVVSFDVVSQAPKDGFIRAWCQFLTSAAAGHAHTSLNGRRFVCVGQERLWVNHIHSLSYVLEKNMYLALRTEIQDLTRFAWIFHGVQILVNDKDTRMHIKISANDSGSLGRIKKRFERMRSGEKLFKEGKRVWHGFFSTPKGVIFLTDIEKAQMVYIRADERRRSVTLFGGAQNQKEARKLILRKVDSLQARHVYSLPLSPQLILQLLKGSLTKLFERLGKESIELDLVRSNLVVHGTEEAFKQAISIIALGKSHVPSHSNTVVGSNGNAECPICFNELTSPEKLDCGHIFCRECLTRYLRSASEHSSFPLRCLGKEATCVFYIPLSLAKRLLSNSEFEQLIETAFRSFVHARPKEFLYCPTPDCPQIYRLTTDKILHCPSCLVHICPNCHEEQHDGEECMRAEDEDERLFADWKSKNGVKSCPGCKANIEKVAGCNHMTCSQCQTHICWVCMDIFENGDGIYSHMRAMHGGIGI